MFKGKKIIFLSLIGIPLSLVLTLIVMYIALFGFQLPFDLEMKVQMPNGKWVNKKLANTYLVKSNSDSLIHIYDGITTLIDSTGKLQYKIITLMDTLYVLKKTRDEYKQQIASLQEKIDNLEEQKQLINKSKIARLDKIFKEVDKDNLDSLFIASLDDYTIMAIIAQAKAKQAAAILQRVEPKRAAYLTSKFLNDRK